jgi:hypothetical protein
MKDTNPRLPLADYSEYKDPNASVVVDRSLLVWASVCDCRFGIEIQRTEDPYAGVLCIFDLDNGEALLHSENVTVAFGAPFGPDAADVASWQDKGVEFIDNFLK